MRLRRKGDHTARLRMRWYVVKWRSLPRPMERLAAATVRRPEESLVPYTRVRIWQNVGRVNTEASGWSKSSDSGERDMHAPPREKSSRPLLSANDPLLQEVTGCRELGGRGSEMRRVTSSRRQGTQQVAPRGENLLNASTRHLVYYEVTQTKIGACWTQSWLFSTRGGC